MDFWTARKSGFTLIEILIATSIGAMLLTAMVSLLFTFTQVTGDLQSGNTPTRHTQMLERFLADAWREASYSKVVASPQGSNNPSQENDTSEEDEANEESESQEEGEETNNSQNGESTDQQPAGIEWGKPKSWDSFDDPLLTFYLKEANPLLHWEGKPAALVQCHLYFVEDEGLYLLWRPTLMVEDSRIGDEETLFQTLLSPYVVGISYHYYDKESEEWEKTEEPDQTNNQEYPLPQAIELALRFPSKEERSIFMKLPSSSSIPIP